MTFAELLHIALTAPSGTNSFTSDTMSRLERLGAFAGKPAIRFIASTAVRNGTFQQFASFERWNEESRKCVERFVAHTGFQPRLATGIFEGYASCLGWNGDSGYGLTPPHASVCDVPEQERLRILNGSIHIDREKERYRGVTVETPCITAITGRGIRLTAILKRTEPLSSATLNYALRNATGSVIDCGICGVMTAVAPSVLPISADLQCDVSQIGSIGLCIS